MTGYRTLAAKGEAELVIQRSRFIGRSFPVESEAAALAILADIRKAHWDASHNCFAYRIGPDGGCARYSDDGEPGGTAGLPMMEVLKSRGLTDLLVVVTRYFGGILLGAGGLVRAYSRSAAAAIQAAGEVEVLPALRYHMAIPYNRYGGLEPLLRERIVRRHIRAGVRVLDPNAVYIDPRVTIGRGTMLLPGTILRGETAVGCGCTIGPNAVVRDCVIGDETEINASQVNESTIGSRTYVGPFAYVRPGCAIGDDIKVGDFVEVKNSAIGDGTKISHLTYVGDSDVGRKVNFGCGTVTTNYDGVKKYRCTIEDGAFIGCNTNLVAPVTVGAGSYIAAGATITKDVPADALAVARAKQENKEGWAKRRRKLYGQEH